MATLTAPITVGTASASPFHAADLGKIVFVGGRIFRVCKATSAIASAAKKFVVSARTAGVPTWNVAIDTTAAGAYKGNKTYVQIPVGQVGSDGSTGLLANDYFLGQVSGPTTFIASAALAVGNSLVIVVNSLGTIKAATLTTVLVANGRVGYTTHTAATTAANVDVGGMLVGLI